MKNIEIFKISGIKINILKLSGMSAVIKDCLIRISNNRFMSAV